MGCRIRILAINLLKTKHDINAKFQVLQVLQKYINLVAGLISLAKWSAN